MINAGEDGRWTAWFDISFLPFYLSVSPQDNIFPVLRGMENTEIFSVFHQSLFLSILPLCVCECARPRHNCSISSGFSPCYPLKKEAQNRISAPIVQETHCVDSRHFSCELLKSSGRNLQCNRRRADKSVRYENNKSKSIQK